MGRVMILPTLICGFIFMLSGCEKDAPKEDPKYYLGKWKLMNISFAWTIYSDYPIAPIFDFSKRDIMYDFRMGDSICISGEIGAPDLMSNTEQGCWDLYLHYGIGAGEYKYTAEIAWEPIDEEYDWCWWSLKIGDKDYGLTASGEKSQMRITKVFPFNDLPWINTRTSSEDAPPSAWFEAYFEKVE